MSFTGHACKTGQVQWLLNRGNPCTVNSRISPLLQSKLVFRKKTSLSPTVTAIKEGKNMNSL
jgi:hypothetical protein